LIERRRGERISRRTRSLQNRTVRKYGGTVLIWADIGAKLAKAGSCSESQATK
jgi:hypothetical protein